MTDFKRYAVYFAPQPGALSQFGAAWLGWDPVAGGPVDPPEVGDLPAPVQELTATPRKYGMHATIKAPFRLDDGVTQDQLDRALGDLSATLSPVETDGIEIAQLGGFLALIPMGDTRDLNALAGHVVAALDSYRAPLTDAEIARRKPEALSTHQRALLERWGYPFVMDEFRFHITLTGRLTPEDARATRTALLPVMGAMLPAPFVIDALCLFGEDQDGMFHYISRHTLAG